MTRLTVEDLSRIPDDLRQYDQGLKEIAGGGLLDLSLKAMDMRPAEFEHRIARLGAVAVIPMTGGQGLIPGFAQRLADIGRYLGFPCQVTNACDVAGVGEAVARGVEIIVCADDDAFLAMNLVSRRIADNSIATGEVYAAALATCADGIAAQPVGIIGLGPVGRAAAAWLASRGIRLIVHDKDHQRQEHLLAERIELRGAASIREIIAQTRLVLDATNAPGIIKARELPHPLVLAAPGVPLGLDDPDSNQVVLIHDPLQLGVAAMLVQALA